MSRAFGPTYAGDDLRYPGVWFSFEEDVITRRDSLAGARERSPHPEEKMQEVPCRAAHHDHAGLRGCLQLRTAHRRA